ncbi:MAG: N-acetyltransferase, partial [Candidatus Magasanikbacteria bacterium]|nr:N-acetyltransferase [Candidatus Magasanikbacteria bacterium]
TVRDIKVINFVSAERHKRWEGTLQKKKIIKVWVAKNKANKVVGFCVARKAKLCNILGAIYVLPRYQGKGIGQKLAGVAFEWLGKKDIVVDVVKYNATAIVFYKKLGFKKIGATPKKDLYKLPSGKMLPEVRMVRKV